MIQSNVNISFVGQVSCHDALLGIQFQTEIKPLQPVKGITSPPFWTSLTLLTWLTVLFLSASVPVLILTSVSICIRWSETPTQKMFTQKFRASQFYTNAISLVISSSTKAGGCLTVSEVGKCVYAELWVWGPREGYVMGGLRGVDGGDKKRNSFINFIKIN